MVLVAFVLVLLAAASFAAGIAASRTSDTLIYLSIAFSLGAFVMLAIASLRARQVAREASDEELVAKPAHTIDETQAHAGPLLGGLDPTQLDMTPTWRRQGRRRPEPEPARLDEADEELDAQLEHEEDEADFEVPVEPIAAGRGADEFWWGRDDEDDQDQTAAFNVSLDEFEDDDSLLDLPEPEPAPAATDEGSFFDQYDDLTAAEILPFLGALDLEGLEWVRARERGGAKRATVVNQVEQLIAERGGKSPATSTRKRSTAKKAAPARRATKKSTKSTRRR